MGLTYTSITLENPRRPDVAPVTVRALADTGALHLCVPRELQEHLGLEVGSRMETRLADGSARVADYAGPVRVRFGERECFAGAIVLGDEVLLGAVPLEDLDLVIDPRARTLRPNTGRPGDIHGDR